MKPTELQKLLTEAEKIAPRPKPAKARDLAIEMHEVIFTLYRRGMTYKKMMAWLSKRGFKFRYHHIGLALRHHEKLALKPNPPT